MEKKKRIRYEWVLLPAFIILYLMLGGDIDISVKISNPIDRVESVNIIDTLTAKPDPVDVITTSVTPKSTPKVEYTKEEKISAIAKNTSDAYSPPHGVTEKRIAYINRWKETAVKERLLYGIPASVTLAQGGLESNWGASELASHVKSGGANNHFGMKYHGTIPSYVIGYKEKRERNGKMAKFRKYKEPWYSYRDHSKLLTSARYKPIERACGTNYKCWALWLGPATKKAPWRTGYAEDPLYGEKLIKLINELGLYQFDGARIDHYEKVAR